MSNDMPEFPDEIYIDKIKGVFGTVVNAWFTEQDNESPFLHKYYSESYKDQLIKEAEERQREKCVIAMENCLGAIDGIHPHRIALLREAILNAGGE